MGFFDKFWEMKKGGPYEENNDQVEVFKCTECGAETHPDDGWDGEPDLRRCRSGCSGKTSDWRPGRISDRYRHNYNRVFPDAPGVNF